MESQPFAGVNVLDFTWAGVGPFTTNYLAFYGAMVIKVESRTHTDITRIMTPYKDNIPGIERSAYFTWSNPAKKYGITLNLNHPKGVEIARRLVAWADIVAESFTAGTMEKWSLGYEDLKKIKPDIIMLRTCMHGQTGPLAKHPGQGMVLTALVGLSSNIGWPDRPPSGFYGAYSDFIAPLFNAVCLISALDYRRRTGKGQYLDLSQHEASVHFLAPLILDYTTNQRQPQNIGNRLSYAAPHGIYRCRGDDRWCAIAVFTDEEWKSFCKVIGNPAWTRDPKFATLMGRIRNVDELDRLVEEWTINFTAEEVMTLMQEAGVGAGIAANAEDVTKDPQMKHYHFFNELDHPEMGRRSHYHGPGFILSKAPYELARATLLGEYNEYVCTKILGISEEEFVQLMEENVI